MQDNSTFESTPQLISDYLSYLEMERGLSKNTIFAYENDLISLFNFLSEQGMENLDSIKRRDLSSFTKYLAKKEISPTSITRKIASIKGFFKYICFKRITQHFSNICK